MVDISFVLLTFNSAHCIAKSVGSIVDAVTALRLTWEIRIVDNGSTDGTIEILKRLQIKHEDAFGIEYLAENKGTTASRNMALRLVRGAAVVVLDSDAYVNAGTITTLMQYLDGHEDCGIVVPAMTYADGRYQMNTDQFPTLFHKFRRLFKLKDMEQMSHGNIGGDVDYAISAFWMMRRSLLEEVGLLDENIFYSPEDVDYCIRVWKTGLTVHQLNNTTIIHDAQELSRPGNLLNINRYTWLHLKGLFYLFLKHRFFFTRPDRKQLKSI